MLLFVLMDVKSPNSTIYNSTNHYICNKLYFQMKVLSSLFLYEHLSTRLCVFEESWEMLNASKTKNSINSIDSKYFYWALCYVMCTMIQNAMIWWYQCVVFYNSFSLDTGTYFIYELLLYWDLIYDQLTQVVNNSLDYKSVEPPLTDKRMQKNLLCIYVYDFF